MKNKLQNRFEVEYSTISKDFADYTNSTVYTDYVNKQVKIQVKSKLR